jgi:hypothetical protein
MRKFGGSGEGTLIGSLILSAIIIAIMVFLKLIGVIK